FGVAAAFFAPVLIWPAAILPLALSLFAVPLVYIGVMFFSIGVRIIQALSRHSGIRGSPVFTTAIASVENGSYKHHAVFYKLNDKVRYSIDFEHEAIHGKGKGEFLAYLNQAVAFIRSLGSIYSYILKTVIISSNVLKKIAGLGVLVFMFLNPMNLRALPAPDSEYEEYRKASLDYELALKDAKLPIRVNPESDPLVVILEKEAGVLRALINKYEAELRMLEQREIRGESTITYIIGGKESEAKEIIINIVVQKQKVQKEIESMREHLENLMYLIKNNEKLNNTGDRLILEPWGGSRPATLRDFNSLKKPARYNSLVFNPDTEVSVISGSNEGNVAVFVLDDFSWRGGHGEKVTKLISLNYFGKCNIKRIHLEPGDWQGSVNPGSYLKALNLVLNYAKENPGVRIVVNLSLGHSDPNLAEFSILRELIDRGVVIIAGAGNEYGKDKFYPAAYEGVVGVAAVYRDVSKKTIYSNYGPWVDICTMGEAFVEGSGTSFAAPRVTGLVAYILKQNPGFSAKDAIRIIKETATPLTRDTHYEKGMLGAGRLNTFMALYKSDHLFRKLIKIELVLWSILGLAFIIKNRNEKIVLFWGSIVFGIILGGLRLIFTEALGVLWGNIAGLSLFGLSSLIFLKNLFSGGFKPSIHYKPSHFISKSGMLAAAVEYKSKPYVAGEFNKVAAALGVLEKYITHSGKLKGPPVVAYRTNNNKIVWNLTLAQIKEILIYEDYDEDTIDFIIFQIKLHESFATEKEAVSAQAEAIEYIEELRGDLKAGLASQHINWDHEKWNSAREAIFKYYQAYTSTKSHKVFGIEEFASGKSTVIFPVLAYLFTKLQNKSVFVLVSQNYFSYKHAECAGRLLASRGVRVGYITSDSESFVYRNGSFQPLANYEDIYDQVDVIYGLISQFNFDYQRNFLSNLRRFNQTNKQWVLLADEADKTLVEEVFSPHVISAVQEDTDRVKIKKAYDLAVGIANRNEFYTREGRVVVLNSKGEKYVRKMVEAQKSEAWFYYFLVEQALSAILCFKKDTHYFIENNGVVIIGESGEPLKERRWQDYLHVFIELKEGLEFKGEGKTVSLMYLTNYINSRHIAGFIGLTGSLEAELAREIYPDALVAEFTNRNSNVEDTQDVELYNSSIKKLSRVAEIVSSRKNKNQPVLIKVGSPEEAGTLKDILATPEISVIDAHNCYNFDEIGLIEKSAGSVGKITIVTSVGSRGIDVVLTDLARDAGMLLIDSDLSSSSLDGEQFKGRGARRIGDRATIIRIYSLEDSLFQEYESLTSEAKTIFENYSTDARKIISILHRRVLEERIRNASSQRKLWDYVGRLWQELVNIRTNIRDNGVGILYGENAKEIARRLSSAEKDAYGREVLQRIDSKIGSFFEKFNIYKQRLDYVLRHYSSWQRLWQMSYSAQLAYGAKISRQSTVKDIWSAIAPVIQDITEKTKVEIPSKQIAKRSCYVLKPIIALVVLSTIFGLFYYLGVLNFPLMLLARLGIQFPALNISFLAILSAGILVFQKLVLAPALSKDTSLDDLQGLMNTTSENGWFMTFSRFVINRLLPIMSYFAGLSGLMLIFAQLVSPQTQLQMLFAGILVPGITIAKIIIAVLLVGIGATTLTALVNRKNIANTKIATQDNKQDYRVRRIVEFLGVGLVGSMLAYTILAALLPMGVARVFVVSSAILSGYLISSFYWYVANFRDTPNRAASRLGFMLSAPTFTLLYYLLSRVGVFSGLGGISVIGALSFTIIGILMIAAVACLISRISILDNQAKSKVVFDTLPINMSGVIISAFGIYGLTKAVAIGLTSALSAGWILGIIAFGLVIAMFVAMGKVKLATPVMGGVITATVALGFTSPIAYAQTLYHADNQEFWSNEEAGMSVLNRLAAEGSEATPPVDSRSQGEERQEPASGPLLQPVVRDMVLEPGIVPGVDSVRVTAGVEPGEIKTPIEQALESNPATAPPAAEALSEPVVQDEVASERTVPEIRKGLERTAAELSRAASAEAIRAVGRSLIQLKNDIYSLSSPAITDDSTLTGHYDPVAAFNRDRQALLIRAADLEQELARKAGQVVREEINSALSSAQGRAEEQSARINAIRRLNDLLEFFVISFPDDPVNYGNIFTFDFATTISALSFIDTHQAERMLGLWVDFFGNGQEGYFNAYRLQNRGPREIRTTGPIAHMIIAICNYEERRESNQPSYMEVADNLARYLIRDFWVGEENAFRFTNDRAEVNYRLLVTEQQLSAYAAFNKLYNLTRNEEYRGITDSIIDYLRGAHYTVRRSFIGRIFNSRQEYFYTAREIGSSAWVEEFASDIGSWAILSLGPETLQERVGVNPRNIINFLRARIIKNDDGLRMLPFGQDTMRFINLNKRARPFRGQYDSMGTYEWTTYAVLASRLAGEQKFANQLTRTLDASAAGENGILPYATREGVSTGFGWDTPRGRSLISTLGKILSDNNINIFAIGEDGSLPLDRVGAALGEFRYSESEARIKGIEFTRWAIGDIQKGIGESEVLLGNQFGLQSGDQPSRGDILNLGVSLTSIPYNSLYSYSFNNWLSGGLVLGGRYGNIANIANITYSLSRNSTPLGWIGLVDQSAKLISQLDAENEALRLHGGILRVRDRQWNLVIGTVGAPEATVDAEYNQD
ncbi:MAG: S8 family serine peptidase, partial [Candidatus Omnitrophica bacterium]|nr:S8 family serine peptidase [Candidatus Omnitrophota bacterium]